MRPDSSSVADDGSPTGLAPTFCPMVEGLGGGQPDGLPCAGQRFGDFELLRVLGRGSFATVFLARQVSLDRPVALKVTADFGSEARTLARLEHDHIVQVFSEGVAGGLRLLCMQYVAGTTLEHVLDALKGRPRPGWGGRAMLEVIDRLSTGPAALHPAALRGREELAEDDHVGAVCRLGARLAEALDYAHGQGVLHRDIKPANILVSQYGRPLLADFNLASAGPAAGRLGGTLAYMAPEHLDAFNREDDTPPVAVDRRSDTYALGLVLFELLTGELPSPGPPSGVPVGEALRGLAAARRAGVPPPRQLNPGVPPPLDRVIRRCLEPLPGRRYQTAGELALALEGCGELRRIERELPTPGPLTRAAAARPFLTLVALALLPHVLGSAVNIGYNALRIVRALTAAQQGVFSWSVLGYNLVMYPACLAALVGVTVPGWKALRGLERGQDVGTERMAVVRRGVLRWPLWAVVVSCLGWLPGGVLFPLALAVFAGPIDVAVFGHFALSFTVSGLIALTYSFFAVQFLVLRVFYCRLWVDGQGLGTAARAELGALGPRLRGFQFLAVLIPLAGAVLMVGVGPEISGYRTFRLLVTALLVLGMAGFGVATVAQNVLSQTLAVLVRPEGRGADRSSA